MTFSSKQFGTTIVSTRTIAGGWHGVIMEYIEGTKLSGDLRKETRDSLKKAFLSYMTMVMSMGTYAPRTYCSKAHNLMYWTMNGLVWRERPYPDNINSDCNEWHEGVQPCGKILKEHIATYLNCMYTDVAFSLVVLSH